MRPCGALLTSRSPVYYDGSDPAILNAVEILRRDLVKTLSPSDAAGSAVIVEMPPCGALEPEAFEMRVDGDIRIVASDRLGAIYGLLHVSGALLGVRPFWFWMDQAFHARRSIDVEAGTYRSPKPCVQYRGWFINDEVLLMKWRVSGDVDAPWRMAFEALLRCGGNMIIPGTDKEGRKHRALAASMGLKITHHHAEPLGAEMFLRAWPGTEPNYLEYPELFERLWEEAVLAQKDMDVIWTLGFRGQGDCPFWSNDTTGQFDTPEKRGALISRVIRRQRAIVARHVPHPVFCTHLYGEIMELYDGGCLDLPEDVMTVRADNGYGKMVTRRRDNHTARISSLPRADEPNGGVYYHVSFYDLQAANHITMLPNSVDFVCRELDALLARQASAYWIVNGSNIRPHVYFLDAIRKKWLGQPVSGESHSREFAAEYFPGAPTETVAALYRAYPQIAPAYGPFEDQHAGEQFYNENVRLIARAAILRDTAPLESLRWLLGTGAADLYEQTAQYAAMVRERRPAVEALLAQCARAASEMDETNRRRFGATLLLHVGLHRHCAEGVLRFAEGMREMREGRYLEAFLALGDSAAQYDEAYGLLERAEYGVWKGYYANECLADIRHTAFMVRKLMGVVRELGDNPRHDLWYRLACYAPEDREIFTLLVTDNHMTDGALYDALSENRASGLSESREAGKL